MSVLKDKRTVSKAEYVNTANAIYVKTIDFLSRMSARYSRLLAADTAHIAGQVMDHCEEGNSIYPSPGDAQRKALRRGHLLEARAALNALDVRLTHCYLILSQNPQGAFTGENGKTIPAKAAIQKLDNMAQELGDLINKEADLLKGVMDSDRGR